MNKRVIVEDSLKSHIEFLEKSGYKVDRVGEAGDVNNMDTLNYDFNYDAVVVSSLDSSSMENPSFRASAPVVEAKDKTPEEVFNILRSRY